MSKEKKKRKKVEKLEIGAGERRNPEGGWVYQDIQKLDGIDIVCDAKKIDDYVEEGSVRQLRACHVLEHFATDEIEEVLETWKKIMMPGGRIYIEVPNFEFHAQLVMGGRHEEAVIYAFGGQTDKFDFHKTGFTQKILHRRLEDAGFTGVQVQPDTSLVATAFKPE